MAKRMVTFRFHERTIRKLIRLAQAQNKTKTAVAEYLIWKATAPAGKRKAPKSSIAQES